MVLGEPANVSRERGRRHHPKSDYLHQVHEGGTNASLSLMAFNNSEAPSDRCRSLLEYVVDMSAWMEGTATQAERADFARSILAQIDGPGDLDPDERKWLTERLTAVFEQSEPSA